MNRRVIYLKTFYVENLAIFIVIARMVICNIVKFTYDAMGFKKKTVALN